MLYVKPDWGIGKQCRLRHLIWVFTVCLNYRKLKVKWNGLHCLLKLQEVTLQAHNIETTSFQPWFNVKTLNQRWNDVVSVLCACWVMVKKNSLKPIWDNSLSLHSETIDLPVLSVLLSYLALQLLSTLSYCPRLWTSHIDYLLMFKTMLDEWQIG